MVDGPGAETNNPDDTDPGLITREELYELVWSRPMVQVAATFGLTDVAVAKWCRKLRVPRPGRGYWARVAAGHTGRRPPLPSPKPGEPTAVERPSPAIGGPAARTAEQDPPPGLEAFPEAIPVPVDLDRPHRVVRATRAALRRSGKDEYGVRYASGDESMIVSVSDAQANRALRILDGLVRALEAAGHAVTCVRKADAYDRVVTRRCDVTVLGEPVPFHLAEKRRRTERPPTEKERREAERWSYLRGRRYFEYTSTGKLSLVVGYPGEYRSRGRASDGRTAPLEARLRKFVELLLREGVRMKEERLAAEARARREAEEREIRLEEERRWQIELRRRQRLERVADRWRHAQELRAFIAAVLRTKAKADGPHARGLELWLMWARGYVNELDPLVGETTRQLLGAADQEEDDGDVQRTIARLEHQLERLSQGAGGRSWSTFRYW